MLDYICENIVVQLVITADESLVIVDDSYEALALIYRIWD